MLRVASVLFSRRVAPTVNAVRWCTSSVNGEAMPSWNEARSSSESMLPRRFTELRSDAVRSKSQLKVLFSRVMKDLPADRKGVPHSVYQLVKACGSDMVLENPARRVELVEGIWKQLREKGIQFEVALYNMLLQVYLQNNHKFPPSEFMEKMTQDGVMPNKGTLSLLLHAYCQQGNMAGAMQILEHIKSLDLPINEHVYASLIMGHARSGSIADAKQLMSSMGEQLLPGIVSYTALLCAHAEKGDMEAIHGVIGEMRAQRLFPSMAVYLKMMDTLSQFGHGKHIPELLELVRNKAWIQTDLRDLVFQCAMRGDIESAMLLLRSLREMGMQRGLVAQVIVRGKMESGAVVEEVIGVIQQLRELGFKQGVYEEALSELYQEGQEDGEREPLERVTGEGEVKRRDLGEMEADILMVLRTMWSNGVEVKRHYFFPILARHANQKDLDGVLRVIQVLQELGLQGDYFVFKYCLKACDGEVELLQSKLQERGLLQSMAVGMASHVCNSGQFEQLLPLLDCIDGADLNYNILMAQINTAIRRGDIEVDTLLQLYPALHALQPPPHLLASVDAAVVHVVQKKGVTAALEMMQELAHKGVPVSGKAYQMLLNASFSPDDGGQQFFRILRELRENGVTLEPQHHHLILKVAAHVGDSIKAREAIAALRMGAEPVPSSAHNLFICAIAKAGYVNEAKRSYSELRDSGAHLMAPTFIELIKAVVKEGDLATAETLRNDMIACGYTPNRIVHNAFIETYAKRGDLIKSQEEFRALLSRDLVPNSYTFGQLMAGYAVHGDHDTIRELMKETEQYGVKFHRQMSSSLLDAYINSDKLEEAVAMLSEFPSDPPFMSTLATLTNKLVAKGKEVDRVVEVMRTLKADPDKIADILFYAHLRAGDVDGAKAVLLGENFKLKQRSFLGFARECKLSDKLDLVHAAVDLIRQHGSHLSLSDVSAVLLNGVHFLKDTPGAQDLQEELESTEEKTSLSFDGTMTTLQEIDKAAAATRDS